MSDSCSLWTPTATAPGRLCPHPPHRDGAHTTVSSGSLTRRSVEDSAPGCLPRRRPVRRRSDRSLGFRAVPADRPDAPELGYDSVDVLGISWGGGVAQHFAAFWRSRCRRLVLVATATGALRVPAKPSVLVHMVLPPRRQMDRDYLYRVVGQVFGGSARRHPERAAAMMSDGDWLGSPPGYLYQLTAAVGWTSLPFLPVIRQSTLIVAGDDDPVIPLANARLLNLLIPGRGCTSTMAAISARQPRRPSWRRS
jgi:pimeloyl-ACP methyl ester carboxylesterase